MKEIDRRDLILLKRLQSLNIVIKEIDGDGACLFRSASDQIYGDRGDGHHKDLRHKVCQWLTVNQDCLKNFFSGDKDFDKHIREMRKVGTYADHHEIIALSAILNQAIHIHSYDFINPLVILHDSVEHQSGPPLLFSRHRENHYNSLYHRSGRSNEVRTFEFIVQQSSNY